MSLYTALGVPEDADVAAIQRAYEVAVASMPESLLGRARAWLQGRSEAGLERARRVLSDPQLRAAYDLELAMNLLIAEVPPTH